eukprot:TRINITY_DN26693_c0_g1_i1.p1 TRINITY_DN26693_c0_g1~~TRINITY_DN26693_c0_g1_i1.p1  ORF type:complete len:450 (-),score=108.22 TRINITY_DN26693_c0_g1_i1:329-1678(-)
MEIAASVAAAFHGSQACGSTYRACVLATLPTPMGEEASKRSSCKHSRMYKQSAVHLALQEAQRMRCNTGAGMAQNAPVAMGLPRKGVAQGLDVARQIRQDGWKQGCSSRSGCAARPAAKTLHDKRRQLRKDLQLLNECIARSGASPTLLGREADYGKAGGGEGDLVEMDRMSRFRRSQSAAAKAQLRREAASTTSSAGNSSPVLPDRTPADGPKASLRPLPSLPRESRGAGSACQEQEEVVEEEAAAEAAVATAAKEVPRRLPCVVASVAATAAKKCWNEVHDFAAQAHAAAEDAARTTAYAVTRWPSDVLCGLFQPPARRWRDALPEPGDEVFEVMHEVVVALMSLCLMVSYWLFLAAFKAAATMPDDHVAELAGSSAPTGSTLASAPTLSGGEGVLDLPAGVTASRGAPAALVSWTGSLLPVVLFSILGSSGLVASHSLRDAFLCGM